jgi:hypothetical protein
MGEDESVIDMLKDCGQKVRVNWVAKVVINASVNDQALEQVSYCDGEVRGERVALPKSIFAVDLVAGDSVEEYNSFA